VLEAKQTYPLRTWRTAIHACIVSILLLYFLELDPNLLASLFSSNSCYGGLEHAHFLLRLRVHLPHFPTHYTGIVQLSIRRSDAVALSVYIYCKAAETPRVIQIVSKMEDRWWKGIGDSGEVGLATVRERRLKRRRLLN
jgi:hypothetical protein